MWIAVILVTVCAAGAAYYIVYSSQKAEMQKYQNAARKMIKGKCLDQAIRSYGGRQYGGVKIMIYLKWKDGEKQGYVFDPEQGIYIGRAIGENDICVRDKEVSGRHCMIYISQGRLVVQDLNSANGTFVKHGIFRQRLEGPEPLYTGDRLIVGGLRMKVTVFTFDTAYI